MSPSWYDLLGVSPTASNEEIRAAWRDSIADLDPTDRRFRVLNEAAEVLLDPERRAEHDRELAPEPPAEEAKATPATQVVRRTSSEPETLAPSTGAALSSPRRGIPGWVLTAVAALTAAMVVLAVWLYQQPADATIRDATSEAQGAAERAVVTILAYDYRTMDEDQDAAGALMTPEYREEYDKLFAVVKENAPATKTVVTVEPVVASGIVRSGEDRVQVLVFVNRPTTNAQSPEPRVFRDQVTLTMEKVGEEWLVDDLITDPPPTG